MKSCECREPRHRRCVVLTGEPGAGKTTVLELIRASFCTHVKVLPEAAGVIFGGGFPRVADAESRRAAQRAAPDIGYNWQNSLRTETAAQASEIDDRILHAWEQHPRRFTIEASSEFLDKAARAIEILRGEMPECCKQHVVPVLNTRSSRRP